MAILVFNRTDSKLHVEYIQNQACKNDALYFLKYFFFSADFVLANTSNPDEELYIQILHVMSVTGHQLVEG